MRDIIDPTHSPTTPLFSSLLISVHSWLPLLLPLRRFAVSPFLRFDRTRFSVIPGVKTGSFGGRLGVDLGSFGGRFGVVWGSFGGRFGVGLGSV